MEQRNRLGIYLAGSSVTAVLLSAQPSGATVRACLSVSVDSAGDEPISAATAIAGRLAAANLEFGDIYVAVDCALFTQHELHTGFTEQKQIANTIRFDAEEAIATDATQLAITFSVTGRDKDGSNVSIFAADRKSLSDVLADLQTGGIDPTAMSPDILCLARFLQAGGYAPPDANPLFVVISAQSCYIVNLSKSQDAPVVRSFFLGSSQDKTAVLAREIPITIASQNLPEPIDSLIIAGSTEGIDLEKLAQRTLFKTQVVDLAQAVRADTSLLEGCPSDSDFAIAYGAAMATAKTEAYDFRHDFMPYQGRIRILRNNLRILSVCGAVLMFAVAMSFQIQVIAKNKYINRLKERSHTEYAAVMYGAKPPSQEAVETKLRREYRRLIARTTGNTIGDDGSIPAKLTFIFEAFNNDQLVPQSADLQIESISIAPKNIRIKGSTVSRSSTLKFFEAIEKHEKLKISQRTLPEARPRSKFTITVEVK